MLSRLCDADPATSGGKAGALAVLLRGGFPVPDGFVVPNPAPLATSDGGASLQVAVAGALARLGDPVVAVRSSASDEDGVAASAAGQYETVIGVRGTAEVCHAIASCRMSAGAARVGDYRRRTSSGNPHGAAGMAVLVQRVVEAEVSGVMFTPQRPGEPTRIEASWGLGLSVVGGIVTPDAYEAAADGTIDCLVGSKLARIDLAHGLSGVVGSAVAAQQQTARTLDDGVVAALAGLGGRIAGTLGGPQDVEWAVADGKVWILQSRPITAELPARRVPGPSGPAVALTGTPGSHGTAAAPARIVRGPSDFATVRRGDILVCPYTDPAWTPLFTVVAGVVTETGGALSHAAIVAREYGIPAVLGVAHATSLIDNGAQIAVDGTAGTIAFL